MDLRKLPQHKFAVLFLLTLCWGFIWGEEARSQYLSPEKRITQFAHEAWNVEDGLPQGSINAIAQTKDGYMWFGTQDGLARFDGLNFKVFDTRNVEQLRSNNIRVLEVDSRGALWIGTMDAGLIKYQAGKFDVIENQETLSSQRVVSIVESIAGHLWIGTSDAGLKKLRNGVINSVEEIEFSDINALYETGDGALWIGTRGNGLVRLEKGEVRVFDKSDGLAGDDVTSIVGSAHGGLWIGTRDNGLSHFHGGEFFNVSTNHGLPSNNVLSLFEDKIGALWIGSDKEGLARMQIDAAAMDAQTAGAQVQSKKELMLQMHQAFHDHLSFDSFSDEQGLTYDVIKAMYQDREGILWLGTDGGGINMLREAKFTPYASQEGVIDDLVYAVHEDVTGAMWFGTEQGVSRLYNGEVTSFSTANGLAANFILSIESTPDSSVWMGTFDKGLIRYKDGKYTNFTKQNGLPGDDVFALYRAPDGKLWIGTGSGAAVYDGNQFTYYSEAEGLSSNFVTTMIKGKDNAVWIGTYSAGLNKIVDGKISHMTLEEGLSSNSVLSLHEDNDGVLWIGTYGGGLNRIEDGQITSYTTRDGLFNDNVVQILEDDDNNLWMSCNQGLFKVSKAQLNEFAQGHIAKISSVVYDQSDGLRSREFNGGVQPAGWKGRNGKLWFPSNKGVAMVDPNNLMFNPYPPQMVLEKVIVDGEPFQNNPSDIVEFEPGQKNIEFHYAGLSFIAPEKITYKYKLESEGETAEWVDASDRRVAYYMNLTPGHYTFKVKAVNSDGLESREASSYSFYLKPFFYQTIWFYIVLGVGTVLIMFVGYRLRVAQLKLNEQKLEQLVDQRTRKLEERTADLLKALEENKEILGVTSHDLKNPLGGIIGLADILLEDLDGFKENKVVEEGIENVQMLKNEAERMLRIVMDLLDRHRSDEQDKRELETVNMVHLVSDSVRHNLPAAQNKFIDLHFENNDFILVDATEDALIRVVDNLVSNAVKYSPYNSEVWLDLTVTNGNRVRFSVKDQGPGLTDEDLGKVFGKMQRLSAQPTGGEHSTGLGLFIVKQMIEEFGGEVGVDSVYGNGSTFWFELPVTHTMEMVG